MGVVSARVQHRSYPMSPMILMNLSSHRIKLIRLLQRVRWLSFKVRRFCCVCVCVCCCCCCCCCERESLCLLSSLLCVLFLFLSWSFSCCFVIISIITVMFCLGVVLLFALCLI